MSVEVSAPRIVVLGKIVAPYGVRGAVKVFPFADDPLAWGRLPRWWLRRENNASECWQPIEVHRCRQRKEFLVVELGALQDRDAAEALRGSLIGVPREALPSTGQGEYYWADLIGLEVVNTRNQILGRVLGLIETPGNAVLRVGKSEDDAEQERLLPFVESVVLDVDLWTQRLCVNWEIDW